MKEEVEAAGRSSCASQIEKPTLLVALADAGVRPGLAANETWISFISYAVKK
jgi:hypothetical protein